MKKVKRTSRNSLKRCFKREDLNWNEHGVKKWSDAIIYLKTNHLKTMNNQTKDRHNDERCSNCMISQELDYHNLNTIQKVTCANSWNSRGNFHSNAYQFNNPIYFNKTWNLRKNKQVEPWTLNIYVNFDSMQIFKWKTNRKLQVNGPWLK